jgi:hypothetical protein
VVALESPTWTRRARAAHHAQSAQAGDRVESGSGSTNNRLGVRKPKV